MRKGITSAGTRIVQVLGRGLGGEGGGLVGGGGTSMLSLFNMKALFHKV